MATKTTRNAQGGGNIRQRPNGLWEARYTIGRDPGTGKQIQKSVYGKSQKDVRQKLQKICSEIDEGTYSEPSKMTLEQWLTVWEAEYIGNVKANTVKSYSDHIRLHIKPALGACKLSELAPHEIQKFYNALQREDGLSPKTIKNVHGVFHRALEQAMKIGYIRSNPAEACTLPRSIKKEIRPLEDEELAAFLKAIRGSPYELVYYVAVFTGMRQGELLGLTWDCVDFEKHTIYVCKQHQKVKGGKSYLFTTLKNDKPRLLDASDAVMDALRRQKARQERWAKRAGAAWENEENFVFSTEFGRYLCNQTVYLDFKKIVRRLGLDNARFHDLRHTYAVISLKAGDDIKTVQENLGHHTAAFTLDTYAHVTVGMKRASAKRLDQYISTVSAL